MADGTARASILLADDDPAILLTLSLALRTAGHSVEQASDGTKAVDALVRTPFDLYVLDILMPGATGWEVLARAIERTAPGAPLPRAILITGFNQEYVLDLNLIRREGASSMMLKPFTATELLDEVQRVLSLPPQPAPPRAVQGTVRY